MSVHFSPEAIAERVIAIPGARNLRDIGGYPTADGRTVKRGMIYRGGHPGNIPADHLTDLRMLKLKAVLDLRTTEERRSIPYDESCLAGARYWSRDYDLSRGDIVALLRDPQTTEIAMRRHMLSAYRLFHEEQHGGIAGLFNLLVEGFVPLLVNCTAGKDRTGVTIAILPGALGVPRDIIRQDYALTDSLHDPSGQLFDVDPDGPFAYLLGVEPDVWRTMNSSSPDYIDATFEALDEAYGGVEGYLRQRHGIDRHQLTQLRSLLLD